MVKPAWALESPQQAVVPSAPPSWETSLTVTNDPSQRDRWARLRFSIIGPERPEVAWCAFLAAKR